MALYNLVAYVVHNSFCTYLSLALGSRAVMCNAFVLTCPVEPTRCGAAHSKYSVKREQCGEDVVYLN